MKQIGLLFSFLCFALVAEAQLVRGIANHKYRTLNFTDAIPLYQYLLKRDSTDVEITRKLANSYRLINQTLQAESLYGRLTLLDTLPEDKIQYAELLVANRKYDTARAFLASPELTGIRDNRVSKLSESLYDIAAQLQDDQLYVSILKLPFNSSSSDFAPVIVADTLIFSGTHTRASLIRHNHSWTDRPFVKLMQATAADQYTSITPYAPEIRHRFNVGPASIQQGIMYYSVNARKKKKQNGYRNLKIMSARFNAGKNSWEKTNTFPYNESGYTYTHPHLSADGQTLFFSSDRRGGYGGMDIYRCTLRADGQWSEPENVGPGINTPGDELFPFCHQNKVLYFASNGWGGLGGLDLLRASPENPEPENLGTPFNSPLDDFAIAIEKNRDAGFFSSNRENAGLDDDIYAFTGFRPRLRPVQVYVIDSLTRQNIPAVQLQFHPDSAVLFLPAGNTKLKLVPEVPYTFKTVAPNYRPDETLVSIGKKDSVVWILLTELIRGCILQGTITDKVSGETLDSTLITILRLPARDTVLAYYTNPTGVYRYIQLTANSSFEIMVSKPGYFAQTVLLRTAGCKASRQVVYDYLRDFMLEPIVIGKAFKIDNIYFDLNKWNIRKDAAKELDKIVRILEDNPEIIIELSSHTDARGNDASNALLSDRRAKSSVAYIISKGIDANRITAKGYGESRLVNRCGNNVKCSEKEHQENRRTEFQVTGFLNTGSR